MVIEALGLPLSFMTQVIAQKFSLSKEVLKCGLQGLCLATLRKVSKCECETALVAFIY